MDDAVFYVGIAATSATGGGVAVAGATSAIDAVLHVYVSTVDATSAGAVASEICAELGLKFAYFTYLPAEETESTCFASPEHVAAFAHAAEHGIAYVLSKPFSSGHRAIPISPAE